LKFLRTSKSFVRNVGLSHPERSRPQRAFHVCDHCWIMH
jgi:hypothetical protein